MKGSGVAVVFGTRPEIIKLSPVIRLLRKLKKPHVIIHTGQHYSYAMDRLFFKQLELPMPDYRLAQGMESVNNQGEQTARMMVGLEKVLDREKPRIVLVQGDTNSVLAAALVVSKMPGILLGHVEAGLRSFDRTMPEELNRLLCDHVADFLFAPTRNSEELLWKEGID